MKKNNYLILGVLIAVIATVIAIIITNIVNNPKVSDKEVLAMADASSEAQLLDKVIRSQNRFSNCIDEVAKIYQQQGIKQLTPEIIEKTKICKSSVEESVSKINGNTYLVKYTQEIPDGCGSATTASGLLNVEVNINTKKTIGNWQNGITFSDTAIQNIDKSLEPKDCESYAKFIGSNGTLK